MSRSFSRARATRSGTTSRRSFPRRRASASRTRVSGRSAPISACSGRSRAGSSAAARGRRMRAPPGRSAIRPTDAASVVAALVVVVVLAAPVRAADGVLVLAPHPDDEIIVAGGILYAAQQAGREVTVAVVTNGDFLGLDYGDVRQNECVAGLAVLGIPEDRIVFLGYPDAGLLPLWNNAPASSTIYLSPYTGRDATYATRGRGGTDLHTALTGAPGPYNRPTLVGDVRALLASARPADVYT